MATLKPLLTKIWAFTAPVGDLEDPDTAQWNSGWLFGEKPPHKFMNWLQWTFSKAFAHLNERGVLGWDIDTNYLAGAMVWENGKVYKARVANVGQNVVLPSQWQEQSLPDMPTSGNNYILYYSDSKLYWKDQGDIAYSGYEGRVASTSPALVVPNDNVLGNIPLATEIGIGEIALNFKNQTVYTKTPEGTVIALLGGGALTINVTPILSGPASGYELTEVELTIDNYSDDVTYVLYPPAGATNVSRVVNKIYFTPAEVSADTPVQFGITGEHIGVTNVSIQGYHDFTVLNVPLIDDEVLEYDDTTMDEFSDLNSTQLADTDTTLESITIDTTNITDASSSADTLVSLTRLIEGENMVIDGVDLVAGAVIVDFDGANNISTTDIIEAHTTYIGAKGTISASSERVGNEVWRAVDDLLDSVGYSANATTATIDYFFDSAEDINKYTIEPRSAGGFILARCPKDWTLKSSPSGAFAGEEITRDTQTGIIDWADGVAKTFTFVSDSSIHQYYRLAITLNNGDVSYVDIGEIELIPVPYSIDTAAVTAGGTPTTAYINEHRALSNISSNTGGDTTAGLRAIQSTLEFETLATGSTSADTLYSSEPIENGDNIVIVKDNGSVNEVVASGVDYIDPSDISDVDLLAKYEMTDNSNDTTETYNATTSGVTYIKGIINKCASVVQAGVKEDTFVSSITNAIGTIKSASFRINLPAGYASSTSFFDTKRDGSSDNNPYMINISSSGLLQYLTSAGTAWASTGHTMSYDVDNHIVVNFISVTSMQIFVNDVDIGTFTVDAGTNSNNSICGVKITGSDTIKFDQLEYFSTLRTIAQVKRLYNVTKTKLDTTTTTAGEIPSRTFAVDANPSFEISGGFLEATKDSDVYTTSVDTTLNPDTKGSDSVLSNGNLTVTDASADNANSNVYSTEVISVGDVYIEVTITNQTTEIQVGIATVDTYQTNRFSNVATGYAYLNTGDKETNNSRIAYGASYTTGDIIGIRYKYLTRELEFYKNGVSQGVAYTLPLNESVYIAGKVISNSSETFNFGATAFTYPVANTSKLDEKLNTVRQHNDVVDITGSLTVQTRMLFRRAKAKLTNLYAMIQRLGV